MNEYSEVSQLRTQIAILESQLDHQTSSLRQQLELQTQINKHLTLEGGSDLAITDGRIYNAFLNAVKEAINYTHSCESDSELLHTEVFNLANKLAINGYGNEAVKMHGICNGM